MEIKEVKREGLDGNGPILGICVKLIESCDTVSLPFCIQQDVDVTRALILVYVD